MTAATLHVDIMAGRALASKDRNGLSDPYCKIVLEDERGVKDPESKRKTEVQKKTLNPQWNSSFSFVLSPKHKTLVIRCWDKDRIGSDFMGEIVIPLSDVGATPKEGWIPLQQKRNAKKQEKITGDLNVAVRISGDASTVDLKEKQKVARTLNKLFDQTMSALDIISYVPCNMTAGSKTRFGTLVATGGALYFYSERKAGRRKVLDMTWWNIADMSADGDSVTVTLGMKGKVYTFQDLVERGSNTLNKIIETWNEKSRQTKPAEKRKSRLSFGSIGKKHGTLKSMKDQTSSSDVLDMVDISEYTDMSELSEAPPGSPERGDDVDFLKASIEDVKPIAAGRLPEKTQKTSLPVDADGIITAKSSDAPIVHFIAKRGPSIHNPGLDSLFIKLVECQNLPEQAYGAPNAFVETHVGVQLYISAIETGDRYPVFSEEYLVEANSEKDKELVFSVFHKPKGSKDEFIGEAVIKIEDIPVKDLTTIRKQLVNQSSSTRVVRKRGANHNVLSVGRAQVKVCYDIAKKFLRLTIVRFQALQDTSDGVFMTVKAGSSSYFTQQKDGEYIEFNESFEFKSVPKDGNLILCVCNKRSGKPVGMLVVPVIELQRELPNLWVEIPVDTRSDSKRQITVNVPDEDASKVSKPISRTSGSAIKFSSDSFEDDEELNEEQLRKAPESAITGKKDKHSEVQSGKQVAKGIDKTYIIAALGSIFFLMALLYTWFF